MVTRVRTALSAGGQHGPRLALGASPPLLNGCFLLVRVFPREAHAARLPLFMCLLDSVALFPSTCDVYPNMRSFGHFTLIYT